MKPQDVPILLGDPDMERQETPPAAAAAELGKIQAQRPLFISEQELAARIKAGAKTALADGITVIGNTSGFADINDVPLRMVCRCVRFDLAAAQDRDAYAELFGKAGDACGHIDIIWEKQVVSEDRLIIYVTYTETLRVSDD